MQRHQKTQDGHSKKAHGIAKTCPAMWMAVQVTWCRSHGAGHMVQVKWYRSHGAGHMVLIDMHRTDYTRLFGQSGQELGTDRVHS